MPVPFTGKTGWGAFSAHIPEDGNAVVIFGPHVGVDATGVVGQLERMGQSHSSTCCGAAVAAHNAIGSPAAAADPHDIQQQMLSRLVAERKDQIEAHADPMVGLTLAMYDICAEYLLRRVYILQFTLAFGIYDRTV